ncbi:MAG: (Fe-S)-binding protein [Desulfovibrionaceae bacterium]|nr:(Fe-S)-binding protein [Desulfovibrionaceae bacterium]MBF0514396.1 (Fe-S)-binding protein [Desulfovibrionaceae bacterium]
MSLHPIEPYHCVHGGEARIDCVLCGKCLTVCPLFHSTKREELSPKAKFHLLRALGEDGAALREKPAVRLAGLCLSCGKCEKACPRGLCVPDLLGRARARHPGWRAFVWKHWVARAGLLWPMAASLSRALPAPLFPGALGAMMGSLAALDGKNVLTPWLRVVSLEKRGAGEKVAVFPGCTAAHAHKDWLAKAMRLLAGMGFDPVVPDFACCGCTLGHAGLQGEQKRMRLANVAAWRAAGRPKLVAFCATCRCGLKSYAGADLGWRAGEQDAWAMAQTALSGLMEGARFEVLDNAPRSVVYHKPCHGSGDGGDLRMLRQAAGERLIYKEGQSLCCGFGGLLQLGAPELSQRVAGSALAFYAVKPGDQIVTGCSGCTVQFKANVPEGVGAGHWLEIVSA